MKGTPSQGKHSRSKTHIHCRRCGKHTYHKSKKVCSDCGYGRATRMRKFNWKNKRKN